MVSLTNDMLIGIPKIDEQHKELIEMLNFASSAGSRAFSAEETKKTLDFLGDYVVKHFADEETLQKQSGYPKYSMHKVLHADFVKEFLKFKKEFSVSGASAKFTLALNKTIIEWVVKHIKSADAEFGKYYKAQAATK